MSLSVVDEAANWAEEIMDAEWRGRRDREKTVRHRVSRKIGVPESYLFRLQYKRGEMNDVRGSIYRALMHGRRLYGLTCDAIETKADALAAERQAIEASHETDTRSVAASHGMVAAAQGQETKEV